MRRFLAISVAIVCLTFTHNDTVGSCLSRSDGAMQTGQEHENSCWEKALTQREHNECAAHDYTIAEAQMEKVYQEVLRVYAVQPGKLSRIKDAQRARLAFRDAEVEALFPQGDRDNFGSLLPMCRSEKLAKLTLERAEALKAYLTYEEGHACTQVPPEEE